MERGIDGKTMSTVKIDVSSLKATLKRGTRRPTEEECATKPIGLHPP